MTPKTTTLVKMFSGYEETTNAELLFSDVHSASVAQHIDQISSQLVVADNSAALSLLLLIEECICYDLLAYRMVMLRSIPPHPFSCSIQGLARNFMKNHSNLGTNSDQESV